MAFFLGINLIVVGCAITVACLLSYGPAKLGDLFKTDFQNTATFRQEIVWRLDDFLALAAVQSEDASPQFESGERNILYMVKRDGKVCYASNVLYTYAEAPENYNFILQFDGSKVTITKNGKPVDVYGDGYYRDGNDWYVPGYKNYPVDEAYRNIEVYLAATNDPVRYLASAQHSYDNLYDQMQNLHHLRMAFFLLALLPLVLGLLLLIWYLVRRKDKAQADQAIARLTGHIWLEFKLVLLPLLCFFGLLAFVLVFNFLLYGGNFGAPFYVYLLVPLVIWGAYFYINDLRYNKGRVFHHSGCASLLRLLRDKSSRYPVQRRIVREISLMFLLAVPAMAVTGCFGLMQLFSAFNRRWLSHLILWLLLGIIWLVLAVGLVLLLRRNLKIAADLGVLLDRIDAIHSGDLGDGLPLPQDSDFSQAAEALGDIEGGMRTALEEQTRSERMKVELITNVSHDLKTPLTSIISYAELLSREEELPDHVRDYVKILNEKAERLKSMVLEVFEVSKAASGNLPVNLEVLDLSKLLRQTLADMNDPIERSALSFRVQLPQTPLCVKADGERLYRVFQNLIQNALQYALEGSRVFLTLKAEGGTATVTLQNTSRDELPDHMDYTARFVRGDESRTDGGSGLGLSIARTFTEACGGRFQVESIADLFVATVVFPLTSERPLD